MAQYNTPGIAPAAFYDLQRCPVRVVVAGLCDKWSLLILCHLSFGDHRFSELVGPLPDISQRMLTQRLRSLERDGLVSRTATPSVPPRVDYGPTERGTSILPALQALLQWGARHRTDIEAAQAAHDAAKAARAAPALDVRKALVRGL